MRSLWLRVLALLVIASGCALFYQELILPAEGPVRFPWASDTMGHLIKTEYLRGELAMGNLYPNIFPDWYAGVQLFRYYAPLPYYLLLAIWLGTSDLFLASGWFIFLCALGGGVSFLLYERRFGLFACTLGGLLFAISPDNVRVALAEGNLPRALAVSLLPSLFFFVLRSMGSPRRAEILIVAGLTSLIVLSHAMMGAIFVASIALFCLILTLVGAGTVSALVRTGLGLGSGLLLTGWWLLPSLTGGITELNQGAMTEALARFPLWVSFNPMLRFADKEIFYLGLGLVPGILLALLCWRVLDGLGRALLFTGVIVVLVTTDFFSPIFNAIPMHHLFWPIRFGNFIEFVLILAILACWKALSAPSITGWHRHALLGVLLLSIVDFSGSNVLVHLRPADKMVLETSEEIQQRPGWRVATADMSMLGSSPTYWLTSVGKREQLYGWGYQGARTATNVASLNLAMERGFYDYAMDRLSQLGVDDVLLLERAFHSERFDERLRSEGFTSLLQSGGMTLYHRDGGPRGYRVSYDVLGIGSGSRNIAMMFPKVVEGASPRIDDYDLAYLSQFKTLVLSRFSYRNRDIAEGIVQEYARAGGRVVVDLTGSPPDSRSRIPKFLGVYSEPVEMEGSALLDRNGAKSRLSAFVPEEGRVWVAGTPQGLDKELVTFDYYRQTGVALGYKEAGNGRIWFVGLNLPFHALTTGDPEAVRILEEAMGMRAGEAPARVPVPLQDYKTTQQGYSFSFDTVENGEILIPVAAHEGAMALVDGKQIRPRVMDNLAVLPALAGRHQVELYFEKTGIYTVGLGASLVGLALLLAYVVGFPWLIFSPRRSHNVRTEAVPAN